MTLQEAIEMVRQRADIIAVVGDAVRLTRRGRSHVGLCPFHREKTPSFHVNVDTGRYYCFGCGQKGSVIDFVMQQDGLSFMEALRQLADRFGVELPDARFSEGDRTANVRQTKQQLYDIAQLAAAFFEQQLRSHPQARVAREELARRHLQPASPTDAIANALQSFRVGYAPHGWDGLVGDFRSHGVSPALAETLGLIMPRKSGDGHYDFFRGRLVFAVIDGQGRVVGFSARVLPDPATGQIDTQVGKYINSPESPIYTKSDTVFGLYQGRRAIRHEQVALIVEGNFDVVSLHAVGLTHAVAPLGTAFTENQARRIRRLAPSAIVMFDGDSAGKKATAATRAPCSAVGLDVRVAVLPQDMDPDDYVRAHGVESLQRLLSTSRSMIEYLIDGVMEENFSKDDPHQSADRVRRIAEIIRTEQDPTVRAMAQQYADKIAGRLELVDQRRLHPVRAMLRRAASWSMQSQALLDSSAQRGPARSVARSCDARTRLAMEMLGCLIEYPGLWDDQEIVAAVGQVEGDIVYAFKTTKDCHADAPAGRAWADVLLQALDPSMHDFAARHLAVPVCADVGEARTVVLENGRKLRRLNIARDHKQVVRDVVQANRTGDVQELTDLMMEAVQSHKKRLGV